MFRHVGDSHSGFRLILVPEIRARSSFPDVVVLCSGGPVAARSRGRSTREPGRGARRMARRRGADGPDRRRRHRRTRHAHRGGAVDPLAGNRAAAACGRARLAVRPARPRSRHGGAGVLDLLCHRGAGGRLLRADDRVRRGDADPGPRRRPGRAVRGVGGHHPLLLSADPAGGTCGASAGGTHVAGDRRRRPGAAGCGVRDRGADRDHAAVGRARRPGLDAGSGVRRCRRRPGRRGRDDQGGAVPVPLVAARRHGRPGPGQRLPARGGDGQGRHLPPDALRRRGVGVAAVAMAARHGRRGDGAAGRRARVAAQRSQGDARLLHDQPARSARGRHRRRDHDRAAGRERPRRRARPVQVRRLHDRGAGGAPRRDPRPA